MQHLFSFVCGTLVCLGANPFFQHLAKGSGVKWAKELDYQSPRYTANSKELQRQLTSIHPSILRPPGDLKEFASSGIPNRWVRGLASEDTCDQFDQSNYHQPWIWSNQLITSRVAFNEWKKWRKLEIMKNLLNRPALPRSFLLAIATNRFACHAPGRAPHLHNNFEAWNFWEMLWKPTVFTVNSTSKEGHECCRHLLLPFVRFWS